MSAQPPENSIHPLTRAELRAWLADHCDQPDGVWLITFKKATGEPRVEYDDVVEECLCFGWVDSKPAKLDANRSMLYLSPRKPGSNWSKPNKIRAEAMIAAGLMTEPGQKKIDRAKSDGTWSALDEVEELVIPPDLLAELQNLPPAESHFAAFPRSVKRGILEWILNAKRSETRAKRIQETASLAQENKRANQWRT